MSKIVDTIKKFLLISAVLMIAVYLISLNIENQFITLNSRWISNLLVFSIVCSAFASIVVFILCEYVRYKQTKLETEHKILYSLANLYSQVKIIQGNCRRAKTNNDIVTNELVASISNNAMMILDSISQIDYKTFSKMNKVCTILADFQNNKLINLKMRISNFSFLGVAVTGEKARLAKEGKSLEVRSNNHLIDIALSKIINETIDICDYLNDVLCNMNSSLGNRYKWKETKVLLDEFQDNFVPGNLEKYLNEK